MPEHKFSLEWPAPGENPGGAIVRDDDARTTLAAEYNDHGAWARHYSTVRMTLGTFFLVASIGVIYQRWEKGYDPATVSAAWGAFALGSLIFSWFSYLTFKEMNGQRKIVRSYRTAFSGKTEDIPKAFKLWTADALYFIILAFGFLAMVIHYWTPDRKDGSKAPPTPASHFAVVESAIHQTNHGREAHTFLMDQTTGDLWLMICAADGTVEFKKSKRIE